MRLPLVLSVLSLPLARDVLACGGLFCNSPQSFPISFPVAQSGEGIVFAVDSSEHVVTAVISIQYQGEASDFAWVLPLQAAPIDVDVAPSALFARVDGLTAPRFRTTFESEGICLDRDASLGSDDLQASQAEPPVVQVLRQEEVGPYESAVIESSNPGDMRAWLEDNGYFVTDEMMEVVTPYVTKGDVLMALKLKKDSDVGDIQPIVVSMPGDEVCVPIRMTAIAALDDMEITTLVLSNEGRAIPENYNHVTLNLARIDWLSGGSNYRSLVAEAVDEGSGNAFTTEFSGDAAIFRGQIAGQYDRTTLQSSSTINQFLQNLQSGNLLIHREVIGILVRHLPDEAFTSAGTTKEEFANNPNSATGPFPNTPYDPAEAVAEIWERVVEKEIAMQTMFDRYRFATRLYTLISPEEMTIDPEFTFGASLPRVSNEHIARLVLDCGLGGDGRGRDARLVIEETGDVVELGDLGTFDRSVLQSMPAARRIEQLAEGRVIQDNSEAIEKFLGSHNRKMTCGCSSTRTESSPAWGLVLLFLFVARRRR